MSLFSYSIVPSDWVMSLFSYSMHGSWYHLLVSCHLSPIPCGTIWWIHVTVLHFNGTIWLSHVTLLLFHGTIWLSHVTFLLFHGSWYHLLVSCHLSPIPCGTIWWIHVTVLHFNGTIWLSHVTFSYSMVPSDWVMSLFSYSMVVGTIDLIKSCHRSPFSILPSDWVMSVTLLLF